MEILITVILIGIWITIASLNYKIKRTVLALDRLANSSERIAEVELPKVDLPTSEDAVPAGRPLAEVFAEIES